jgi:UDP-glucose 4-epimerase
MTEKSGLVAGGAGYIGSHCCKALRVAGIVPVVLDNLSTGHRSFVKWGPLIEGGLRDKDAVAKTIGDYGITAVLHFAAHAYVGQSVKDPGKYYDNNVAGTLSLLQCIKQARCSRIIFSSDQPHLSGPV